jgi:hypothetical protein
MNSSCLKIGVAESSKFFFERTFLAEKRNSESENEMVKSEKSKGEFASIWTFDHDTCQDLILTVLPLKCCLFQ